MKDQSVLKHPPASVSSVRLLRVWVPAAASRAMDESVMSLQWARSSLSSWGMWRCSSLRVDSLTSRPDRRSVNMFLSLLRDDSEPTGTDGGGEQGHLSWKGQHRDYEPSCAVQNNPNTLLPFLWSGWLGMGEAVTITASHIHYSHKLTV